MKKVSPQTWLLVVPGHGGVVGGAALAISAVEIFQRCPCERLSQWVEDTGYPLGYCQMLWLLGILPGKQKFPWQPPPPTSAIFCISLFPLSTKVFQGQASIALSTECPLLQEEGQGMGRVEMCIYYNWANLHQYKCICTCFWIKMCVFGCTSMHILALSYKWFDHCLSGPFAFCSPPLSAAPVLDVLSHGSSWVSVSCSPSSFFPQFTPHPCWVFSRALGPIHHLSPEPELTFPMFTSGL